MMGRVFISFLPGAIRLRESLVHCEVYTGLIEAE
jgi:hypothetical protein